MAREHESTAGASEAIPRHAAWRALPRQLFVVLAVLDTLFVATYFALIAAHQSDHAFFRVFNLDKEANLPSWYAGIQLFVIAIGYLVLGSKLIPDRRRVAILRPLWLLLGVGFALLSADEASGLHEQMGRALKRFDVLNVHIFNVRGFDQWMVLYLLIAVFLVLIFSKQLIRAWREWPVEALLFMLGFMVLASGALVSEMIQIMRHLEGDRLLLEAGIEEWLEMFGATILVLPAYRVLSYAMTSLPDERDEAERGE